MKANPEKRIAVEFVSSHDHDRLGWPTSSSTVQSYDFKQVAKSLTEAVREMERHRVGRRLYRERDPLFLHKHYNATCPVLSLLEDLKSGGGPTN